MDDKNLIKKLYIIKYSEEENQFYYYLYFMIRIVMMCRVKTIKYYLQ